MSFWKEVVTDNPMVLETRRIWRRFFRASASRSVNLTAMILGGLIFIIFIASIWNARQSIPPISLIIAQTAILLLVIPSISHGAFAGERERRSWDLLLVAPLKKSQIVAGKFMACLGGIVLTAGFFLIPLLISAIFYYPTHLDYALLAEFASLSFGVLLCAITLAISAVSKRAFAALAGVIGLLVFLLGVVPMLLAPLSRSENSWWLDSILLPHPFYLLMRLYGKTEGQEYQNYLQPMQAVWMSAAYLGLATLLLWWTVRTLQSEDGDGRFTIRRKHA